jgi:hypothetical protein
MRCLSLLLLVGNVLCTSQSRVQAQLLVRIRSELDLVVGLSL